MKVTLIKNEKYRISQQQGYNILNFLYLHALLDYCYHGYTEKLYAQKLIWFSTKLNINYIKTLISTGSL